MVLPVVTSKLFMDILLTNGIIPDLNIREWMEINE